MEKVSVVSQRDVLLVPFPFSDQSGKKVRPVLILSKDSFNSKSEDIIVCAITSNLTKDFYSVQISNEDFEEGTLFETSQIKVENILKLDKKLIIKKIGKLNENSFEKTLEKVRELF